MMAVDAAYSPTPAEVFLVGFDTRCGTVRLILFLLNLPPDVFEDVNGLLSASRPVRLSELSH